jgi:hypothetical protein
MADIKDAVVRVTPTQRERMLARLRDSVEDALVGLIDAKWSEITEAMDSQAVADATEGESDEPTKFRLGIAVAIQALGDAATHECSIAWSVRHKAASKSERVDANQPSLPGVGE